MSRVRSAAVFLGVVYVVGSVLGALLMAFAALYPYEKLATDELAEDDGLAFVAPAVVILAVATLVAIVKRRPGWATMAFAAEAAVGGLALRLALVELSDRSDAELIAFAAGIGIVGLAAVTLSFGRARSA